MSEAAGSSEFKAPTYEELLRALSERLVELEWLQTQLTAFRMESAVRLAYITELEARLEKRTPTGWLSRTLGIKKR